MLGLAPEWRWTGLGEKLGERLGQCVEWGQLVVVMGRSLAVERDLDQRQVVVTPGKVVLSGEELILKLVVDGSLS